MTGSTGALQRQRLITGIGSAMKPCSSRPSAISEASSDSATPSNEDFAPSAAAATSTVAAKAAASENGNSRLIDFFAK